MKKTAALNVLIPIVAAMAVNAVIFTLGWNNRAKEQNKLLPPGIVIGVVWIVIFGFLGFARYLVRGNAVASWATVAIMAWSLAYPFATAGLRLDNAVLFNTISLIVSFTTALLVYGANKRATLYFVPLLIWVSYVNIVDTLGRKDCFV